MAEKRRFLDVWLVEANTVYREVPYTVVSDWIQQSRLLADDMIRPSGTKDWFKVGSSPEMSAYLPQAKEYEVEDQAEVLEPVEMDFAWKKSSEDEEEDVDMIPLIDISLVLLIFFIMTAATSPLTASVETPVAVNGLLIDSSDLFVVIIDLDKNKNPRYSFAAKRRDKNKKKPGSAVKVPEVKPTTNREDFLRDVEAACGNLQGKSWDLAVEAHKDTPSGPVREILRGLAKIEASVGFTFNKYVSVGEMVTPKEEGEK